MKKIIYTITGISLFVFISCGPNAEKNAAEKKEKRDSVAQATKNQIAKEKAKQDSIAASEANKAATEAETAVNQEALKNQLIELKAQLAGEETKMDDIKKFHIGRLDSEKEQQIANQTVVIERLKNAITDDENQIKK